MTRLILALGLAVAVAGCGKDTATTLTSPTIPEVSVDSAARLFSGTLAKGDTNYYSFTLPQDSGVFVTLASVTSTDQRDATQLPLGVGLGVPRGTECVLSSRVVTPAALTPQLRVFTPQGVRCVAVFDPGTLPAAVRYAVRIGYYR